MGFVKLRQIHIENEIIKMRDASCADFNAAISAVKKLVGMEQRNLFHLLLLRSVCPINKKTIDIVFQML